MAALGSMDGSLQMHSEEAAARQLTACGVDTFGSNGSGSLSSPPGCSFLGSSLIGASPSCRLSDTLPPRSSTSGQVQRTSSGKNFDNLSRLSLEGSREGPRDKALPSTSSEAVQQPQQKDKSQQPQQQQQPAKEQQARSGEHEERRQPSDQQDQQQQQRQEGSRRHLKGPPNQPSKAPKVQLGKVGRRAVGGSPCHSFRPDLLRPSFVLSIPTY